MELEYVKDTLECSDLNNEQQLYVLLHIIITYPSYVDEDTYDNTEGILDTFFLRDPDEHELSMYNSLISSLQQN